MRNRAALVLVVVALGGCRSRARSREAAHEPSGPTTYQLRPWGGAVPPDEVMVDGKRFPVHPHPDYPWADLPVELSDLSGRDLQAVWHWPCGDRMLPLKSDTAGLAHYDDPEASWIDVRVDNRDGEATELAAGSYVRKVAAHEAPMVRFPRPTCADGATLLLAGTAVAELAAPDVVTVIVDPGATHCYDVKVVHYGVAVPGQRRRYAPLRKKRAHLVDYYVRFFPEPAPESSTILGSAIAVTAVTCR